MFRVRRKQACATVLAPEKPVRKPVAVDETHPKGLRLEALEERAAPYFCGKLL